MFSLPQMGLVVFALVVISFSSWITCHTVLCARLMRRSPWRGLVALVVVPLAPYYAAAFPKTRRTWAGLLAVYGVTLLTSFLAKG